LELAARVKRREEWDKLAFLRLDLRKMLRKNSDELCYCDFNPVYTKEERAKIRAEIRKQENESLPKIGSRELYERLTAK